VLKHLFNRRRGIESAAEQSVSKEMSSDWYDNAFESTAEYHKHYTATVYYPLWTVILYQIGSSAPRSILEIGCGPGQLAQAIHDHFPQVSYCGFDFSNTAISMAKSNVPSYHFEVADALHTDLYTGYQQDLIICTEVLEHVEEDTRIIERVATGIPFIGSVPNFDSTSHVRFFRNAQAVEDRYGHYFDEFGVNTFHFNAAGGQFFLFEGTKR
jgi:trans-aconitate methyltransferase